MSYANLLFAPCILVECIASCFKWNKRNKRIEREGRMANGIDPEDSNDPEYRAWHEKHFGEGSKGNANSGTPSAIAINDGTQSGTSPGAEKEEEVHIQPSPLEEMTAKKNDHSDPAAKPSMLDV
ncbi:hypothetical protein BDV96DRAFT_655524 [Lophiotrema nucula]|uniref:Uncharacterized protein n=1 Tax=Lophiotrema nucula TaxID=690887 RepID=A0A6A5YE63_9PLEO|nr:hypothetical protein BDV96DRAFT_655524 [Lophiotrema nucula]